MSTEMKKAHQNGYGIIHKCKWILFKLNHEWKTHFNQRIKLKSLMYCILILIFIWLAIISFNILNLRHSSLSSIKLTSSYLLGLRDYNEVFAPTLLWKFGLCALSDKHDIFDESLVRDFIFDISAFDNIRNGDIVWIKELQMFDFVNKVLPNIDAYFTLIIATNIAWITPLHYNALQHMKLYKYLIKNGDKNENIFERLMANKYLLYVYAENYDGSLDKMYEKIEAIPIGFDFHTAFVSLTNGHRHYGHYDTPSMQEYKIKQLKFEKFEDRKFEIYIDATLDIKRSKGYKQYNEYVNIWKSKFGQEWVANKDSFNELLSKMYSEHIKYRKFWYRSWVQWSIEHRIEAKNERFFYFDDSTYVQYDAFVKRSQFLFSLSPWGNGLDCHRTYEALMVGNIVIVQSSPLDAMFQKHNLPIVSIKDFKDINESMLRYWYNEYKDKVAINNAVTRYKLTNQYWMNYIRQNTFKLLKTIKGF